MKKLYTLALFALCAFTLNAQVEVTLAVDMTNETVSANGVYLAGNIQSAAGGSDWTPGDAAFELTDPDGNGVYSVVLNVPAGEYQYKYLNGNDWGTDELGITPDCGTDSGVGSNNRIVTVPDETTFTEVIYLFNTCDASTLTVNNVKELSTIENITVAPNPMSERAVVTFENTDNAAHVVTLTSLTGQVVRNYNNVTGNTIEIERAGLSAGVYFLTFQNELGEVGAEKLIIK